MPTKNQARDIKSPDRTYSFVVIEIDDLVPRRDPTKPNLYVAKALSSPEQRYEQILRGNGPKKFRGLERGLRQDLSVQTSITDSAQAKKELKLLKNQLASDGYTVNGISSVWTVYVIELDPPDGMDVGRGYLYVGETYRTPEERFAQHMNKARNKKSKLFSGVVARRGLRLRMDLAPQKRIFDKGEAKRIEAEWGKHLESLGYKVEGGH